MDKIERFFRPPESSFFLFGPRGCGKSTWLKQHYKNAVVIDLLLPDLQIKYQTHPEDLTHLAAAHPASTPLIIDEVQKAPEILSVVHHLMEQDRKRVFILTGSSSRKLKKEGVDLLAGRAIRKNMHPFMASELGNRFSLEKALREGMVPVVVSSPEPAEVLNTYLALYLKEEVQQEGLLRNLGSFSRFLEAMSFSHGSVLNLSNISRECSVDRKVVEGYVDILEDLLLGYRLPVFTKKAKRKPAAHPKFYFFDAGVLRRLRPAGPLDSPQEIGGALLEGLVAQHLRAWIDYSNTHAEMFYWRTVSGNEVDFILYGPDLFVAIEVKSSRSLAPKDFNGLKAFREDYPQCTPLLLYGGRDPLKRNDILCLPIESFLRNLRPDEPVVAS